jgi:hypothetical protein
MNDQELPDNRYRYERRSPRRVGSIAAGLIALALSVAACSHGSSNSAVASVSSSAAAGKPKSVSSTKPSPLAYARCMQSHGITDFPEPDSNGNMSLQQGQPLPDVNSPQFQAAAKACVSLNPAGVAPNPAQQAKYLAAAVAYAKCMRSHGVANFPDPGSDGSFNVGRIDPTAPQVQSADKACARDGVGLNRGRTS